MWIRSQDGKQLVDIDSIRIDWTDMDIECAENLENTAYAIYGSGYYIEGYKLGIYSTEEKAIKVLDMIEGRITEDLHCLYPNPFPFQMPKDDEVGQ